MVEITESGSREETIRTEDDLISELLEGHERALDRHKVGLEAKMWMQQAHTKGRKSKKVEFKTLDDNMPGGMQEERSDDPASSSQRTAASPPSNQQPIIERMAEPLT